MNVRGLGGIPKRKSLQRMIKNANPDIIMFQETMLPRKEASDWLKSFLYGWNFVTLDAQGLSGGLISGWNDSVQMEDSTCFNSCIDSREIKD